MNIRPFNACNKTKLRVLTNSIFGKDYFDIAKLDNPNTICLEAITEVGAFVGFVYGHFTDTSATLETICVDPEYENKGIGYQLGITFLNALEKLNIGTVISPAWKDKQVIPADPLLRKLGFFPQKTIKNYWYEDSKQRGYQCLSCGNPCFCSAVIYELRKKRERN